MNPGQWVALISGVIAAVAVVIAAIIARGKSRENQLIDQLQEELTRAAEERAAATTEREKSARRDRILQNYIYQLNKHIVEGLGPPPPPWPEELFKEG